MGLCVLLAVVGTDSNPVLDSSLGFARGAESQFRSRVLMLVIISLFGLTSRERKRECLTTVRIGRLLAVKVDVILELLVAEFHDDFCSLGERKEVMPNDRNSLSRNRPNATKPR